MSISAAQALVRAFHQRFGVPAPNEPNASDGADTHWPSHRRRLFTWIRSELQEGQSACIRLDISELADAYIDVIYFALGGLVELGIDGGPLFDAVHASNMLKTKLPDVAKIAKPPGWKAPDIAGLIEEQRQDIDRRMAGK